MLDESYNFFQGGGCVMKTYKDIPLQHWEDGDGERWAVNPRMVDIDGDRGLKAMATFKTEEEAKHYIDKLQ